MSLCMSFFSRHDLNKFASGSGYLQGIQELTTQVRHLKNTQESSIKSLDDISEELDMSYRSVFSNLTSEVSRNSSALVGVGIDCYVNEAPVDCNLIVCVLYLYFYTAFGREVSGDK